jgi:hypothetical protein
LLPKKLNLGQEAAAIVPPRECTIGYAEKIAVRTRDEDNIPGVFNEPHALPWNGPPLLANLSIDAAWGDCKRSRCGLSAQQ